MENNFAFNLKYLRQKNKLTQEDLGKALHKNYSTIGKWENGTRSPTLEDAIKVAKYFKISLDKIITGKIYEDANK